MTTFAYSLTIASLVLFAGFVIFGIWKFGLLPSYSAYADKWAVAVPIDDRTNLWSAVTIIVAMLMVPALVDAGYGNPWQFLGFFCPLYLIVVGFTPQWAHSIKQHIIHSVGAFLCAGAAVCWLILVRRQLPIALFSLLVGFIGALATKSLRKAYTFWGEMVMFASVYISLLIPGA